jgi:hypothetical protein
MNIGKSVHTEQILVLGVVAGGLYLLYQAVQGLKDVGGAAAGAAAKVGQAAVSLAKVATAPISAPVGWVASEIWRTWHWATSGDQVPSGAVVFPDGTKVAASDLSMTFNDDYNVAVFAYKGVTYVIAPNPDPAGTALDSNGDYHAITWNTFAASLSSG